jgi:hypothetical protein
MAAMSLKVTYGSAKDERSNCAASRARRQLLKVEARRTFAVEAERRSIRAARRRSKPSKVADDELYEARRICAEVSHAWILTDDPDCWSSVKVLATFVPAIEDDV